MKHTITIDGKPMDEDATITLAMQQWPFTTPMPSVRDAIWMLRSLGYQVIQRPTQLFAGVDNGVSGAVAIVSVNGALVDAWPMPVRKRGKNEVDVERLRRQLMSYGSVQDMRFVVEEPVGSKSLNAAKSMAASFHAVRGLIEGLGGNFQGVPAREWQRALLGKTKGDTKELALAKAQELWPDFTWLASSRCKVPHDGMVDAALIAVYAIRKMNQ
jgi:hypothetical protein